MKIHALLEGGAGDWICSNRFAHNILQQPQYKGQKIHIFSSTDEKTWQSDFITSMWPSLYSGVTQVRRKSSNFPSQSQFGVESIPARIENLVDEDREKMLDCDKFFNLWIDGLEWLGYPECRATLNYFPPAEKQLDYDFGLPEKYLALHPMSRLNSERRLEDFYVERLIKDFAAEIPVVVITEKKYIEFYSLASNWSNVTILPTDLYESWYIIQNAAAFIGVDSSLAHMSKSSGKPHFIFNNFCQQPFQIPPFQQIRWIQNANSSLPPNYDIKFVKNHVLKCIDNYANFLYPIYAMNNQDVDNAIVRRKFL